jgi:hypothetical protein
MIASSLLEIILGTLPRQLQQRLVDHEEIRFFTHSICFDR